ncbi:MAG: hypothetical protein F4Y80_12825 [Caldilineaceae bacterium SB0665_bin_21]|nr:hypothetical protein [Caldilineaceae bacterium SB0665_bin_21]
MLEIQPLKRVSLREAWPDEARDFTPWLASNIDLLGDKLDLKLEQVQTEVTLPGAGRVDIYARQANTEAKVVIENQLGGSDDSHCLRLLGYAANAEANILVWVARAFTPYHKNILQWLNDADTIHVYAVTVRAYRVGEALAADFHMVVEPPQPQPGPSRSASKNSNTLYAEFYRPLVARLRRRGVRPVGKGGWRGQWRSFQTVHPDAIYATQALDGETARVFLYLKGPDRQQKYRFLLRHREEIDGKVNGAIWGKEGGGFWDNCVALDSDETVSLTSSEEKLEIMYQWMTDNLLLLKDALQPHLDRLMQAEGAASGAVEGVD